MKICITLGTALCMALATVGCASNLKQSAHTAIGADIATTGLGIVSGVAVEANPLLGSPAAILASGAIRLPLVNEIDKLPEPYRTEALAQTNAITWGIAASNLGVIALSSNPIGLLVGAIAGYSVWKNSELERMQAQNCATAKSIDANVVCKA
jgi:hypothetical protein